jgi:hypothetical protein
MGLRQPNIGLRQPNIGLHQTNIGLRQTNIGLKQPSNGLEQPINGLRQTNNGLRRGNNHPGQANHGLSGPLDRPSHPNNGSLRTNVRAEQGNHRSSERNSICHPRSIIRPRANNRLPKPRNRPIQPHTSRSTAAADLLARGGVETYIAIRKRNVKKVRTALFSSHRLRHCLIQRAAHAQTRLIQHVGVNHGRANILVSKQLLHGADIVTVL